MKSILHDWNDEQALKILLSCKRSMVGGCRLLIVEMLLGDEPDMVGCFYDLHMQVLLGGRERTRDEFISLFERAGLRLLNIYPTKSPMNILEVSL